MSLATGYDSRFSVCNAKPIQAMKTISLKATGTPKVPGTVRLIARKALDNLSTLTLAAGVMMTLAGLLLIAAGQSRQGQILMVAALTLICLSVQLPEAKKGGVRC